MYGPASLPQLAPITVLLILLEIAVGTAVVSYVLDVIGRVGRGFVGTTALICAAVMGLVVLVTALISPGPHLLNGSVSAGGVDSFVHWCVAFALLLIGLAAFCLVGTDAARRVVGLVALAAGAVAVGKAAAAFGPALGGPVAAAIVLVPSTLLAGSALAGMLLGHWYLVAPSLSFRPLRQAIYIILAAVAFQSAVLVAVVTTATPAARDQLLRTDYALPFWLLVVGSGVVFTTAVTLLTLHFARIRANQPATAMMYALIISVVMGVIPAHLLFFLTGAPV